MPHVCCWSWVSDLEARVSEAEEIVGRILVENSLMCIYSLAAFTFYPRCSCCCSYPILAITKTLFYFAKETSLFEFTSIWQAIFNFNFQFKDFRVVKERSLGSKAAAELLDKLKPPYWFSAHLHCKFPAVVQHGVDGPITKFLALDKCLPGRDFLQILEIESDPGPYEIQYDEEWLAITRKFNCVFPLTRKPMQYGSREIDMQDCREWVRDKLRSKGAKPFEFVQTVPSYDPSQPILSNYVGHSRNPQTELFLQLLELPYLLDSTPEPMAPTQSPASLISRGSSPRTLYYDSEYIDIDDVDELEEQSEVGHLEAELDNA